MAEYMEYLTDYRWAFLAMSIILGIVALGGVLREKK
jgi:hypothetical protein